jgi:hypothetical protein
MQRRDRLDQGESKADARRSSAMVAAVEPFRDLGPFGGGNTWAIIGNGDVDMIFMLA